MIRFGIAGFGLHGTHRVMPGFALAERCKVTAISRRDPKKAPDTAKQYGIPHAFTSTEDLVRCPDVDAVFVTSPDVCHLPDALTAIRAGKPVLCEKPMAMNADECRRMVEAAREANVLLGVAHVFRFEESTNRFRQLIEDGAIGRPLMARVEFSYLGSGHRRSWLYNRAVAAGGPITDVGVHCIDILRYITQDEPLRISTVARADENSGTVEAVAVLTLEFSRGMLATVMVSTRADYRSPLEVVGESGVLRAQDALNVDKPLVLELWRDRKLVSNETLSNHLAYARQVDSFSDAIEEKKEFPVPGEEGLRNQIILDAAYRSLSSGKVEEIRA
jgi:predicted dehydrogenase